MKHYRAYEPSETCEHPYTDCRIGDRVTISGEGDTATLDPAMRGTVLTVTARRITVKWDGDYHHPWEMRIRGELRLCEPDEERQDA